MIHKGTGIIYDIATGEEQVDKKLKKYLPDYNDFICIDCAKKELGENKPLGMATWNDHIPCVYCKKIGVGVTQVRDFMDKD